MEQFFSLLQIAKKVIVDWRVIATAICVFIVMQFASYVANYVKKPRKIKKKHIEAQQVTATTQENEDNNDAEE